jgi:UDP-glucuronate 4-epimerase
MHALVTGGAGFIGSHLVDRLLMENWQVTVVDNFDPFYSRAIKEQNIAGHLKHRSYQLIELDICEFMELKVKLCDKYDVIVHLAAKAGVRPSIQDPVSYQRVNIQGTQNLLEFAREQQIHQFIFASSSSVYGVNPRVPWREDDFVLQPVSPYAATKVAGELIGHVYSHLYGIHFIALRFFTVYGPRQRPDLAIHKFSRMMMRGEPVPVFGDGSTRRDYTYITDIVQGIRNAMDYQATNFEVINLGNYRTVALNELIQTLEVALSIKAKREQFPEQPGDVPQTYADLEKAHRLLNYYPNTDFQTGIRNFIQWIQER